VILHMDMGLQMLSLKVMKTLTVFGKIVALAW